MNTKKLNQLTLFACVSWALFSLFTVSFNLDISLFALPLCVAFTLVLANFSLKKLFRENQIKFVKTFRLLLQYAPYVFLIGFVLRRAGNNGTPFAVDLISVILWCTASLTGLVILFFIHPKRVSKVDKEWEKYFKDNPKPKRTFVQTVFWEILSWADALVQAVFMVLLINIFVVQLYEIPSESMVPEFLIRDRVVVFKTASGPKFPLSDVGLPYVNSYDRGDIVVFRNPHYENDRKSEVRTFLSQIVYMCTLTSVNMNVDANGDPIADPLVKRVCGLPGEQLMMQDGVLYSRTKDSPEFKPVNEDAAWACWNLSGVRDELKDGIEYIPFANKDDFDYTITQIEKEREEFHIGAAHKHMNALYNKVRGKGVTSNAVMKAPELNISTLYVYEKNREGVNKKYNTGLRIFTFDGFDNPNYVYKDDNGDWILNKDAHGSMDTIYSESQTAFINYAKEYVKTKEGQKWFYDFFVKPFDMNVDFNGDLYAEANYRLNLMIKSSIADYVTDYVNSSSKVLYTINGQRYYDDLVKYSRYIALLDLRNMPVFPECNEDGSPNFIPENNYFMMGDNRFNSLDMRHSYESYIRKLSDSDELSITYDSDIKPQYVPKGKMLGTASYRFWPLSRKGVPGDTGMKGYSDK